MNNDRIPHRRLEDVCYAIGDLKMYVTLNELLPNRGLNTIKSIPQSKTICIHTNTSNYSSHTDK